jgi:hypothetical protein
LVLFPPIPCCPGCCRHCGWSDCGKQQALDARLLFGRYLDCSTRPLRFFTRYDLGLYLGAADGICFAPRVPPNSIYPICMSHTLPPGTLFFFFVENLIIS